MIMIIIVFATQFSGFRDLMADVPLSLSSEEGAQSSLRMQGAEISAIVLSLALLLRDSLRRILRPIR